ncbi:MAG: hypothetical protein IJ341_12780 [Bacteroidales bacterium]|nr:hypothetical protein [Bacteroidales bacterium]
MKTWLIEGRRYVCNNGKDTYLVVGERYTASGYRYVTLRSDISGGTIERKVKTTDDIEWVDLLGGAIKGTTKDSDWVISANCYTSYTAMTDNESALMNCDNSFIKMTVKELKTMLDKGVLNDNDYLMIQRV